jgi:hypothetical protein
MTWLLIDAVIGNILKNLLRDAVVRFGFEAFANEGLNRSIDM